MPESLLSIQNSFGSNSFKNLADSLRKSNEINLSLSGLGGITDIAKSVAIQMKTSSEFTNSITTIGKTLSSQFVNLNIPKNNFALYGLSSHIAEISKNSQLIGQSFSNLASSQILLSNSLLEISKTLSKSHLNQFNSLNVALQGLSKSFLQEIVRNRDWEDFDFIKETNETISITTNDFVSSHSEVTIQDLENLKLSIVENLSTLLSKTNSEKNRTFLFDLMAVISFILSLYGTYGTYQSSIDKNNKETYLEVKKDMDTFKKELYAKIDEKFNNKHKSKIAKTKLNLKYSTKKNSKIIGIINIGQKVTVIEIRHKYFLITYLDKETQEPKSGFVLKKYFETEK
ncbi:primase-like DNA-binding domain-containing protein [Flavobacterium sp. WC2421]|uniref:primase-like DNA-binding domain-containing protein n=1 Tax=Flavobacterium sp. WC2421 TaxID=3234138 RepID=UPI003467BC5B